jgi:hypothetical protein
MSTDLELTKIANAMQTLEGKFVDSRALGLHLDADGEAEFKRLAIEAKGLLDHELGRANDFSSNLIYAINQGAGGYLGGPSLAAVKAARSVIQGGVNQIRRKPTHALARNSSLQPAYVSPTRLAELRQMTSANWDMTRLLRMVEELNVAYANRCHMSVAMLVKAIADHVPPVFACKSFAEVANNYGGSKSFKGSVQNLQNSLRNIADAHLHVQIRRAETVPTEAQVDFRADLDVLLGEVVRLSK